jgi:uncharacterized protein (TIGR02145 family)
MQGWTGCSSLATPAGTNFTQGPILADTRDCKKYEIRKFSDGKCWMVNNLRYGGATTQNGTTDYCAGKTSALTYGSSSTYGGANPSWFAGANNLYGDCRDARPGQTTASPCYNSDVCGYYYNWQAVMQHASAYYNNAYTPTLPHQGICPTGWHVPNRTESHAAFNLTNCQNFPGTTIDPVCKLLNSGMVYSSGAFHNLSYGRYAMWWTAEPASATTAYELAFLTGNFDYGVNQTAAKNYGISVRCVKN